MSLIASDDVAKYLGLDFSETEEEMVSTIIGIIEPELEAYLMRPLTVQSITAETHVLLDDDRAVYLDATPVVAVSQLKVNGAVVQAADYVARPWGVEALFGWLPVTDGQPPLIEVDYTGGIDGANEPALKGKVLRVVAREFRRVRDDALAAKRLSAEGYAVEYEDVGWHEGELTSLDRWRRRRLG